MGSDLSTVYQMVIYKALRLIFRFVAAQRSICRDGYCASDATRDEVVAT
jgi:hypothetical protein